MNNNNFFEGKLINIEIMLTYHVNDLDTHLFIFDNDRYNNIIVKYILCMRIGTPMM